MHQSWFQWAFSWCISLRLKAFLPILSASKTTFIWSSGYNLRAPDKLFMSILLTDLKKNPRNVTVCNKCPEGLDPWLWLWAQPRNQSCTGLKLSFCFTFLCEPDLGQRTLISIMTYHLIIVYHFMKSNYTCFNIFLVIQRNDMTFNLWLWCMAYLSWCLLFLWSLMKFTLVLST